MPRKVAVPGASPALRGSEPGGGLETVGRETRPEATPAIGRQRGSGRVRHDEKITVYISSDELVRLEQARLIVRAEHGLRADRGRIVREAVAAMLDDLAENGADSELVHRLREQ